LKRERSGECWWDFAEIYSSEELVRARWWREQSCVERAECIR